MTRLLGLLTSFLLGLVLVPSTTAAAADGDPQRVIVQVASAADAQALASAQRRAGGQVRHVYQRVLDGFAATLPAAAVEALRRNPKVTAVVPDTEVHADTSQTNPTWGLDRIDQRSGRNGTYDYDTTGAGVTVYVIDSGIRFSHEQFGGRARSGWDWVGDDANASDCSGHGTHVAGTIGGRTYGVAKGVSLVSLRIFDCSGNGWNSDLIGALDWAAMNRTGRAVVNFSGGSSADSLVDQAVARTTASGLPVVVAAGNSSTDACTQSPARAGSAITVGATSSTDVRAGFSNYGACLDLFAPGVGVLSSYVLSDTDTEYLDGTSMAAPHVAGAVARYLQSNPTATPAAVSSALIASATPGVVGDARSTRSGLLYTAPPPASWPLTVTKTGTGAGTVTSQPAGLTCGATCTASFTAGSSVTLTATPQTGSTFGGWSGSCTGTASTCTVTMTQARSVTATFTTSAVRFEESAGTYSTWYVFTDPSADGGTWRTTGSAGSTATFTFTGTQVTWVTRKGPRQGIATVTVDGVSRGSYDMYAATAAPFTVSFGNLSSTGSHTVVITATGRRNAASGATGIVVDAFRVDTTTVQESAQPVRYGSWKGGASPNATGGLYRSSGTANATMTFTFTGSRVDWLTTMGPGWGRAQVSIDGVDRGTVDLYATTARWQTARTYGGLAPGTHTITIRVLGTKNAAATSTNVAVDGFAVQ